jgi:hypothetical protein
VEQGTEAVEELLCAPFNIKEKLFPRAPILWCTSSFILLLKSWARALILGISEDQIWFLRMIPKSRES